MFSVQYVTAAALVQGRVDLATFFDEPLDAPAVLAVADKTYCVADPASDYPVHFPGEVVVHLKDGRELRVRKPASLGTQEVPLSRSRIEEKFLKNATRAITPQTAEKLIARVYALEEAPSLSEVMALCTADPLKKGATLANLANHEVRQHA